MENESLREPKNTTVMLLSLLVVFVTIWAIIASVMASSRRKDVDRLTGEKELIRQESEQLKQDTLRKMDEVEKLRQTAMEWTRQHQLRLQEEMRKKADEAAKQAQVKADAAKAPVKPVVHTAGKTIVKKSTVPVKKSTVKKSTKKTT
jgi:biopolymer transport protein ExbB/TolQ